MRLRIPHWIGFAAAWQAASCGTVGCGQADKLPNGQLLLYVTTDATLPQTSGVSSPIEEPAALFDHLLIEVYRPGEMEPCDEAMDDDLRTDSCSRDFAVNRQLVASNRASVGLVLPVGAGGYRARVRLFSERFVDLGAPLPGTYLESTITLPPVPEEGVVPVTVALWVDDLGHSIGTPEAPAEPLLAEPSPGVVGSWNGYADRQRGVTTLSKRRLRRSRWADRP